MIVSEKLVFTLYFDKNLQNRYPASPSKPYYNSAAAAPAPQPYVQPFGQQPPPPSQEQVKLTVWCMQQVCDFD